MEKEKKNLPKMIDGHEAIDRIADMTVNLEYCDRVVAWNDALGAACNVIHSMMYEEEVEEDESRST